MRFRFTQSLPVEHPRVAAFFNDVQNLKRITPPFPRMEIQGETTAVVPGAEFTLTLDFGVFRFGWNSVIEAVDPGRSFTDTFSGALFTRWRHIHRFEPQGNGTLLTDEIDCNPVLWFAPFAWIFTHMLFLYRKQTLARLLR